MLHSGLDLVFGLPLSLAQALCDSCLLWVPLLGGKVSASSIMGQISGLWKMGPKSGACPNFCPNRPCTARCLLFDGSRHLAFGTKIRVRRAGSADVGPNPSPGRLLAKFGDSAVGLGHKFSPPLVKVPVKIWPSRRAQHMAPAHGRTPECNPAGTRVAAQFWLSGPRCRVCLQRPLWPWPVRRAKCRRTCFVTCREGAHRDAWHGSWKSG